MNKNMKRAFTITELVIVIAVVAILAAVLIPTFSNLIEKANVSNDTVLVRNLNEALIIAETTEGKPATMHDALTAVAEQGYTVEKLTPRSTGDILWEQTSNRFALVKDNAIVFGDDSTKAEIGYTYWKITSDLEEVSTGEYSYYLADEVDESALTAALSVSTGVDVGNNSNISINYANNEASATAQNVIFRTNGGELTVNGSKDTVSHYGSLVTVDIKAVAGNSYHEYGTILGNMKLGYGRVVLENKSEVTTVVVTATSLTDIAIENKSGNSTTVAATDSTVAGNLESVVTGDASVNTDAVTEDDLKMFAGGLGTEASPYLIANDTQFSNILNGNVSNHLYYELTADIDFSVANADKQSVIGENVRYINLNGNDHLITYNTHPSSMFIFENIGESVIENVKFQLNGWHTLVDNAVNMTYRNLEFYGLLDSSYQGFGVLGYNVYGKILVENCVNYAEINSTVGYMSVFLGRVPSELDYTVELIFKNCVNYANCSNNATSLFLGNPNGKYQLEITNCKNFGILKSTNKLATWSEAVTNLNSTLVKMVVDGIVWRENGVNTSEYKDVYWGGCITSSDKALNIQKNEDGTFTITQAGDARVAKYEIVVDKYFNWTSTDGVDSGTQVVKVSTVINAEEFVDSLYTTTTFKYLDFTTNSEYQQTGIMFDGNANDDAVLVKDSVPVVVNGDVEYFYINPVLQTRILSIANGTPSSAYVIAYDIDGNMLYTVTL